MRRYISIYCDCTIDAVCIHTVIRIAKGRISMYFFRSMSQCEEGIRQLSMQKVFVVNGERKFLLVFEIF